MVRSTKFTAPKKVALLSAVLCLFSYSAIAADIVGKPNLPMLEKCPSALYLSDNWNEKTKRSKAAGAVAYKKLICKSGREAFVMVYAGKQNFSYKLVGHTNQKLSPKGAKMCPIVKNYCTQ